MSLSTSKQCLRDMNPSLLLINLDTNVTHFIKDN